MSKDVCYSFFLLLLLAPTGHALASSISFTGDLRTVANVLTCGTGCTLGAGSTDADFVQYAAVVRSFTVSSVYVKVLAGRGDGQIVTIDSKGRIRVGGVDPGPLRERIQQAVKQRAIDHPQNHLVSTGVRSVRGPYYY